MPTRDYMARRHPVLRLLVASHWTAQVHLLEFVAGTAVLNAIIQWPTKDRTVAECYTITCADVLNALGIANAALPSNGSYVSNTTRILKPVASSLDPWPSRYSIYCHYRRSGRVLVNRSLAETARVAHSEPLL